MQYLMQQYQMSSDNFKLIQNASLKDYCTMKVGGIAKFLVEVYNTEYLIKICKYCIANNILHKIIGLGANIVFSDKYFDGIIIVNRTNNIHSRKNCIYVDSGVTVSTLISYAKQKRLGGLENLAGIPSTVGGAVVNSLSSWGTNFSDYVEYIECYHISKMNRLLKLTHSQCAFGYRDSIFKSNEYVITRVKLVLPYCNELTIQQNIISALTKKSSSQPLDYPSAGSVFVRNGDIIPAKLIDDAKLKGCQIGGAMISTKHAGFIVNIDNATSHDIQDLVDIIRNKIRLIYDLNLRLEIEFVNFS